MQMYNGYSASLKLMKQQAFWNFGLCFPSLLIHKQNKKPTHKLKTKQFSIIYNRQQKVLSTNSCKDNSKHWFILPSSKSISNSI